MGTVEDARLRNEKQLNAAGEIEKFLSRFQKFAAEAEALHVDFDKSVQAIGNEGVKSVSLKLLEAIRGWKESQNALEGLIRSSLGSLKTNMKDTSEIIILQKQAVEKEAHYRVKVSELEKKQRGMIAAPNQLEKYKRNQEKLAASKAAREEIDRKLAESSDVGGADERISIQLNQCLGLSKSLWPIGAHATLGAPPGAGASQRNLRSMTQPQGNSTWGRARISMSNFVPADHRTAAPAFPEHQESRPKVDYPTPSKQPAFPTQVPDAPKNYPKPPAMPVAAKPPHFPSDDAPPPRAAGGGLFWGL